MSQAKDRSDRNGRERVSTATIGRREAAARVRHFVRGARRLAITSESLAGLLGLMESECRLVLDAMASRGTLRKHAQESSAPLYCKE